MSTGESERVLCAIN